MGNRPYYPIWYLVNIRGQKHCFKMTIYGYNAKEAAESARKTVEEKTGLDVIACTSVDPFAKETRAWENEKIVNRTPQSIPYEWEWVKK